MPEPEVDPAKLLSAGVVVGATGQSLRREPLADDIAEAARHYAAGDHAAAGRVALRIVAQQPKHFDALHLLGVLALNAGRLADAISYFRRAERERPDVASLQFNIGNAWLALKAFPEAQAAFRRSLALRPGDADTLNNLGNALTGEARHEEASECFRQALSAQPGAPQPSYNLAHAQLALGQLDAAVAGFRAVLSAVGKNAEPARLIDLHNSLSEALVQQTRYDEALAVCRAAPPSIAQSPGIAWNESLTLLMLGDYAEGWRKYESRFLMPNHDPPRAGADVLDLADVAGRRVLVFPEQGRGDMIQFARYLPMLAARGAHVMVEMYADLKPVFETIEGVAQVVTPDDDVPEYDRLTPLISLPHAFGTEVASIPRDVPYLRVPAERMEWWGERVGRTPRVMTHRVMTRPRMTHDVMTHPVTTHPVTTHPVTTHPVMAGEGPPSTTVPSPTAKVVDADLRRHDDEGQRDQGSPRDDGRRRVPLRVGVAWWGSQHIAKRSMPIDTLTPVLGHAGVEFHALQKEIAPQDQAWLAQHKSVTDHSAALRDFADTAALIAHMDLVISIDTSVAHLAGALGVPVWIMLPFSPDWRWLVARDDSPWYPTARLFRQKQPGDWDDVVRRAADALSAEVFKGSPHDLSKIVR